MVIIVSADVLAPDGARPSAGTMLTTNLDRVFNGSLAVIDAVLLKYGRQLRPMNPPGDPRSYHRWSIWRPTDSLGFTENVSEWKWTDDSTDALIKCPFCLSKIRTPFDPFWLVAWSQQIIDGGLPRTETDLPTINHRWSVRRAGILHFLQHCWCKKILTIWSPQWGFPIYW